MYLQRRNVEKIPHDICSVHIHVRNLDINSPINPSKNVKVVFRLRKKITLKYMWVEKYV
jgi:hypothetical protein